MLNNKKSNNNYKKANINNKNIFTLQHVKIIGTLSIIIAILTFMIISNGKGEKPDLKFSNSNTSTNNIPVLVNQDLVIKVGEISETVKFYPVNVEGTNLEVLAVKAPDGTIRTAFNTCQICYDSGRGYYKQQGNLLVCQNCGNQYPMDRVEIEAGGCNPWPIFEKDKIVTDESITIPYALLKESKGIFANWNKTY